MPPETLRPGARVAIFGAVSLLAKELRSALEQRAFPAREVRLFDDEGEGVLSEYDGEALVVSRPDETAAQGLDLAFFCGAPEATARYLDWAGRMGFTAIDLSGAASGREGIPVVHAEINPADIRPPIIASPHPVAHNVATVAAMARSVAPVTGIEAVALSPVSELGEPAIDELYQQTVGLLSFAEMPTAVLNRQVAFNLIPAPGMEPAALRGAEARIRLELEGLMGWPAGGAEVQVALAPFFHGHVTHLTLLFATAPDPQALAAALEGTRGTRLIADPAEFSPVSLAGEEKVAVTELRPHAGRPDRVSCWLFCDNLKGGSTLNAARIAERVADRAMEAAR